MNNKNIINIILNHFINGLIKLKLLKLRKNLPQLRNNGHCMQDLILLYILYLPMFYRPTHLNIFSRYYSWLYINRKYQFWEYIQLMNYSSYIRIRRHMLLILSHHYSLLLLLRFQLLPRRQIAQRWLIYIKLLVIILWTWTSSKIK